MPESQQNFSSQTWPIGTTVSMINVPWDAAYKDLVQFDDMAARDAWLDSQPRAGMSTTRMTYIGPSGSIILPVAITTAERYNYLYVDNPSYDITDDVDEFTAVPRRYCYFVIGVDYLSPATCRVALQLDAWTTWAPFVSFRRAFLAQGHAGIANRNLWDGTSLTQITPAKMRRYLSTPEAVDPGGDFTPIYQKWTDMTKTESGAAGTFIGVMSSVDLSEAWGTATNPNIKSASGSIQEGMLAGVQVVYFKTSDFLALATELRDAPWVSRNIMQIWLAVGRITAMFEAGTIHGHTYYRPSAGSPSDYFVDSIDVEGPLSRYWGGNRLVAPKLMTAPYSYVELSCFEGSPLILKPQQISELDDMIIVAQGMSMAPWDRIALYPLWYGAGDMPGRLSFTRQAIDGTIVSDSLYTGDMFDSALWITELPRFSFTSDGYLQWLAQGAHSRAWSYQNNDWNYHKSALSRELAHDQATEDLRLAWTHQAQKQEQYQEQFIIKTAMGLADSLSMDILGSVGDMVKTGANAYMDWSANDLANRQFMDTNQQARKHLDQNYDLQGYAMQGDYQQAIARLSATEKDAQITPPSVVGSAGGNGWNYAMGLLGFRTKVASVPHGQGRILCDYFNRFGYAICETVDMPSDLRLMTKFTYWKLQESFLDGNITETGKQTIRGIFERGTTVWNDPETLATHQWDRGTGNGINASNPFSY